MFAAKWFCSSGTERVRLVWGVVVMLRIFVPGREREVNVDGVQRGWLARIRGRKGRKMVRELRCILDRIWFDRTQDEVEGQDS